MQPEPALRAYGPRARRRVTLAARLLGRHASTHGELDDRACARVLDAIEALPSTRREALRALVDWVEDYERHEVAAPRKAR